MRRVVGDFKKVSDTPWNGKEVSFYVEKEYEAHALAIFGDTKEMIEFYSKRLGVPYAWPKYSQIALPWFGGVPTSSNRPPDRIIPTKVVVPVQ